MLRSIIGASLRFRLLVVGLAAGILAVGIVQLRNAPVDVLPEFTPPYAEVQTEAPGLSSEEVEQLITVPLEADLLNGVEGVDVIRSESVPSLSSITMVFEPGTDIYRARQLVQERLTQAHALPNVSQPPTLLAPLSSSSRVLMIGLSSTNLTPIERSVIARWTVKPRLMGVPGVANVAIWGMRDQQIQVQVDPRHLRARDVTLQEVVSTAGNAQVVSPLSYLEASTPGTGGFIETPQQRLQVRNVLEKLGDPKELGKVPVEGTDGRLRLSDVSNIKVDHQPLIGDAIVGGGSGLLLVVEKFPGANTLEVTRGVEAALETLRPGLSGMRTDTSVFRPATLIEKATDNLTLALIIGGVLMALALAALLFDWRTLLVALVTIPLSLVAAALVLDLLGESFNAISFAGLAAALAIVVDEAVSGAYNVLRVRSEARGDTPLQTIVREASHEARAPLAYATIIALVAIVPVAVMEGRPGAFFQPLVLAYALAVAAAMIVALTVTPALSMLLFSRGTARRGSPLTGALSRRYDVSLQAFMRRPRTALIAGAACVVAALAALPLLDASLIPSFKDRDVLVRLDGQPGTSNPRMTRITNDVSRRLRSVPGVQNVGAHVGRAVTGDQIVDVNSSEVWVSIDPGADYDKTVAAISDAAGRVNGVQHDVVTYSTQKIRDVGALSDGHNPAQGDGLNVLTGSDRPLVVRVYGQELGVLRREADRLRRIVSQVDGVVGPRIRLPQQQPTLEIETDLAKARRHGIKPGDVRRAEAALLQGIQVGSVFEGQKVFDVVVQGVPEIRRTAADVRNLLIDTPEGGHVRLGDVATVREVQEPAVIERDAVSRRVDIEAGVSGRSLDAVAGDIRERLKSVGLPLEYHAAVLTRTTAEEVGTGRMLGFGVAAVLAILLLLQAAFRSWPLAALAFATLPVALSGGIVAALIFGAELSLGSIIALVALLALAVRGVLAFVRHLQAIEMRAGMAPRAELIRNGAGDRMPPVLITAVAVALLLAPFVVMGSRPGLEVVHPMAVVIIGGLVTTTFVSLFLLPALYARVQTTQPKTDAADEEEELLYRWLGADPEAPVSATPGTNGARAGAAAGGGEGGPPDPEKTPDTIPATGDAAGQERTT